MTRLSPVVIAACVAAAVAPASISHAAAQAERRALDAAEGRALSAVGGPALSAAEGPALSGVEGPALAAAAAPRRMVFVGSDAFAPYQYIDASGQPRGFNVELMRALARETGIRIDIRLVEAGTSRHLVERGEADLLCLGFSPERAHRFTWLLPLWRLRQVAVFTRPPGRDVRSASDLIGHKVLVGRGSLAWEEMRALPAGRRPDIVEFSDNDFRDGMRRLHNGEGQVMLGNALAMVQQGLFRQYPDAHESTYKSVPYYLAAARGREAVQPLFFAAFTRLQESGEFNAIVERTLLRGAPASALDRWATYVLYLFGIVAAALLGVAAWNRTLRSQVEARTREFRAVAERLEFHGLVQAQVSDAIIVLNTDGHVTMWNAGAEALFGIPPLEALGVSSDDLLVMVPTDLDVAEVGTTLQREGFWRGEARVQRRDGMQVHIEATVKLLRQSDGAPGGQLIVVHDIDARKRAENELRAAVALHRATLGSTAEGIVSVDADDRITSYNQRFLDIWRVPDDVVATGSFARIGEWAGQHVLDGSNGLAGVRHDLVADGVDAAVIHFRDGRVIERYSLPQRLDGEILGRVWSYRDVTERTRADQERRKLELQIQQGQKLESLGVLAGGIAHDFNNLLVGMLGHAGLALADLPPDSPGRDRIQQIETCAMRAAELTNQMLAYSGKGRFVVQPTDLSAVVQEMASLLQTAVTKSACVRLRLAAQLPAVLADGVQLRQVVMNLITNASDAIGDQGGTIAIATGVMHASRAYLAEACVGSSAEAGEYVYIEVSDDGCGMDAETRARIFEPFFTTKFTGRGLGLAAVLGIVRGHRGAVLLETAPGRGTTFRVIFPSCVGSAVTAPAQPARARATKQARILVVDDEPSVRTIASEALTRAGFTVLLAEDGGSAIERFRAEGAAIDAVLLDMTMPGISGIETLRAIHTMVRGVPVVLTSGYTEQEAAERSHGEVIAGFIQKPFAPSALVTTINEALTPGVRG